MYGLPCSTTMLQGSSPIQLLGESNLHSPTWTPWTQGPRLEEQQFLPSTYPSHGRPIVGGWKYPSQPAISPPSLSCQPSYVWLGQSHSVESPRLQAGHSDAVWP